MIKIIVTIFCTYYISKNQVREELGKKQMLPANFRAEDHEREGHEIVLKRIESAFLLFVW